MSDMYKDVMLFNEKFSIPTPSKITPLSTVEMKKRITFLFEEISELMLASEEGNMAGIADGLLDITYVSLGTGIMMGLPWSELWDEVQRSNMDKVTMENPPKGQEHKTVFKPEGWKPPQIENILIKHLQAQK